MRYQPQGRVRLNLTSSLAQGLVLAVLPGVPYNLVDRLPLAPVGNPVLVARKAGLSMTGGNVGLAPPANSFDPMARFDSQVLTALVVGQQDSATNAAPAFFRGNGSGTPTWAVGLHGGSYNGPYVVVGSWTWSPDVNAKQLSPVNTTRCVVLTADGSNAAVYEDGVWQAGSGYTQTTPEYNTLFQRRVMFGSQNGSGGELSNKPYLGLLWNRPLSADEVKLISANPWQLFVAEDDIDPDFIPRPDTPWELEDSSARARYQPQGRPRIMAQWLAKGLKFAYLPSAGFINLATGKSDIQHSTLAPLGATPSGVAFAGGMRSEFPVTVDANNGLTVISIWRARTSSQYLNADNTCVLVGTRTSSNNGWAFGRNGATGSAGSGGNLTAQTLVFQNVAQYIESTTAIESLVDTPVAVRYSKANNAISWFRFGKKSSPDTPAGTPTVGGNLVFGAQGDYPSAGAPWIDRAHVCLVFEGALSDSDIQLLTSTVGSVWQVFDVGSSEVYKSDSTTAPAGAAYLVNMVDSFTITDYTSVVFFGSSQVSDILSAADQTVSSTSYSSSTSDILSTSDLSSQGAAASAATSDVLSATDGSLGSYTINASGSDSLTVSEILSVSSSVNAAISDLLSNSDTNSVSLRSSIPWTDSLSTSDLISSTSSYNLAQSDAVTIVDVATTGSLAGSDNLSDNLNVVDGSSTSYAGIAALADTLGLTDSRVVQATNLASLIDSLGVADLPYVSGVSYASSLTDSISIVDTTSAFAKRVAALTDSLTLTDAVTRAEAIASSLLGRQDVSVSASAIPKSRWIVFDGSVRLVVIEGTTRVVVFKGANQTVEFKND